jgi:hypothetical protein
MSDREILEKAEARELLPFYYNNVEKVGKVEAAERLTKRIRIIQRHYGFDFDKRVRGYMRQVDQEELLND